MNILDQTESGVFLYCRFSLFLTDPFFQIIQTYGTVRYACAFIGGICASAISAKILCGGLYTAFTPSSILIPSTTKLL